MSDVNVVAFCSDGKTMMTGGQDRTLRLWDALTGAPLGQPIPQPSSVDGGAFSPDGKSFVAGCDNGSAQVWDLATRTPLGQPFPHPGVHQCRGVQPGWQDPPHRLRGWRGAALGRRNTDSFARLRSCIKHGSGRGIQP